MTGSPFKGRTHALVIGLLITSSALLVAQPRCEPPALLKSALASDPSAGVYNALGSTFAEKGLTECASEAFEKSIEIDAEYWEPRFNLGLLLAKTGRPNEAAKQLEVATRQNPASFEANLAWGFVLLELGDATAAESPIGEALGQRPESAQALFGMARVRMLQRRNSAALGLLEQAREVDSSSTEIPMMMGAAYAEEGRYEDAIAIMTEVVEAHPNLPSGHFNLATVYARTENFPAAAEHYRKTLEFDPNNHAARMSAAKALANFHKHQEVLDLVSGYTNQLPKTVDEFEVRHLLGVALRGVGRYEEAGRHLLRAAELRPDHSDTRYNLGFVLARQKEYSEARVHLEVAKELDPESADIRFQLGRVLRAQQAEAEAQQELRAFQDRKEADVKSSQAETAASRGNAALDAGDPALAATEYAEAIRLDPNDARYHYDISLAHAALGNRGDQLESLKKALELDPDMERAHNDLGVLYLNIGWFPQAEQALQEAVRLSPQYAEAHNNLGVMYGRQGRPDQAERHFRRAIEDDREYAQAYVNLGLMLAGQERFEEAEREVREAIRLTSGTVKSLTALGMIQARLGRAEESVATLREVVELDPQSAEARLNLGLALADAHKTEEALTVFGEAVELAPESAATRFNRGRMLFQLGRVEESRTDLGKSMDLDPKHAEALYFLALAEQRLENRSEAAQLWRRYIALKPKDARAFYQLGQLELALGSRAAAINQWKRAVELDPDHREALYNLFRELRKDDPEEARRYQERFQASRTQQRIGDRADTLGNFALASLQAGDVARAVEQLEEAIEICQGCRTEFLLHKNLGLIYARSGDLDKAEVELRRAAEIRSDDAEVVQSLATIAKLRSGKRPASR